MPFHYAPPFPSVKVYSALLLALGLFFFSIFSLQAQIPYSPNASAVLGQATFTTSAVGLSATALNGPSGVCVDHTTGKLFVADAVNNRVLRYASAAGFANGQAAEAVLGQSKKYLF